MDVEKLTFGEPIQSVAQRFKESSLEEFLATRPAPFLVQLTDSLPEVENSTPTDVPFGTVRIAPGKVAAPGDHRVFQLKKRSANPFADMITVGRAENNDVVLSSPCVSKFHAFFRATPG